MERAGANPIWNLFDAAAQHRNIRLDCPKCRHCAIYHAAALWKMFGEKGWNDSLRAVPRRFYCADCSRFGGPKVRPGLILSPDIETVRLPLPSDTEWKHAIRRRR